jgi:voltage-gated potassium channel
MRKPMSKERLQRTLDATVVVAALASVVVSAMKAQGNRAPLTEVVDWILWAVFVFYFLAGLFLTGNRLYYARRNWPILAAIIVSVPIFTGSIALIELSRLVVLVYLLYDYWPAFRELPRALSRRGLLYVAGITIVLIVGGGALLWVIEPESVPNGIGEGIYWAIVTVATVGYGDITPKTPVGRLLAVVLMVSGIGLLAALTASIAAYFVNPAQNKQSTNGEEGLDLKQLNAYVRENHERLKRLEESLESSRGSPPSEGEPRV